MSEIETRVRSATGEMFRPSPEAVERTLFESTKRELRYQVGLVLVPAFAAGANTIIEYAVSGATYFYMLRVGGDTLMALDNGDFIDIQLGDTIRCSPIEKLRFKRQSGAGTVQILFIHSNDPVFEFHNSADFTTRGVWNPSGAN